MPKLPEWLKAQSPSSGSKSSSSPEWLPAEKASSIPAKRSEAPEWLSAEKIEMSRTAPQPSDFSIESAALPDPPPLSQPSAEPVDASVPDWLSDDSSSEPETTEPTESDVPDWLKDEQDTPSAPKPTEASVPDWLSDDSSSEPVATEPAEVEVPDWLKDEQDTPSVPEPVEASVPDWLSDASSSEPVATEPAEAEVPDWLSEELDTTASTESKPEEASVPDWLSDDSSSEPITSEPAKSETPDWLSDDPVIAESALPPTPDLSLDDVATQDSLPKLDTEDAETSEAPSDSPAWLSELGMGDGESESPSSAPVSETSDSPDWLDDLAGIDSSETPSEPIPESISDFPELPALDTDPPKTEKISEDWLESLSLDGDAEMPAVLSDAGEDLLGFSGSLTDIVEKSDEEEDEPIEMPDWMEAALPDIDPESLYEGTDGEIVTPTEINPELLEQITDLRFEAITEAEEDSQGSSPEKIGALKDMLGVISPEIIFEGDTLQAESQLEEVVYTAGQLKRIQKLNRYLSDHGKGTVVKDTGPKFPVIRWVTTLLVLLSVALPIFLNIKLLPTPTRYPAQVITAWEELNRLPGGTSILMVFEYEADAAGEMAPIASAFLDHLASKDMITVYGISTRTTGSAMTDSAFKQAGLGETNLNTLNLGYISGRANGISSLMIGNAFGVPSPLSFDASGSPTTIEQGQLQELPLNLVIVLAARSDDIQIWVEQSENWLDGIPLIAGVGSGAAPMSYPYQQSGQLTAVLNGVNDAAAYQARNNSPAGPMLSGTINAQAIGSLVAAMMIVLGGVYHSVIIQRRKQENT